MGAVPVAFMVTAKSRLVMVALLLGVAASVQSIRLRSGKDMPVIGLGTWKAPPGVVGAAVKSALESGYTHLDCAAIYGNEKEVGAALESSGIDRSSLFITSKLWNSEHAPEHVMSAVRQSLSDLKLGYLDLYLIHWPQAFAKVPGTHIGRSLHANGSVIYDFDTGIEAVWGAMEALVDAGLVKAIGLSNFNQAQVDLVMRVARIKPAVLQIESHPFLAQQQLIEHCSSLGIAVTAYSPLGSGAVIDGHQIPSHPLLIKIGSRYGKSAAAVAIAWQVQRGVVVIPKSITESRIVQNLQAANLALAYSDMAQLDGLNRNYRVGWGGPRVNGQPRDLVHPLYPFRAEWPSHKEL